MSEALKRLASKFLGRPYRKDGSRQAFASQRYTSQKRS